MKQYTVALAGNPNTGKSTLFNALTGLRQHTGNWAGKTVDLAMGDVEHHDCLFRMVDLPGTYSLFSNSTDEEVARDFILFEQPDVTIVVLDATSLERNLNLTLQVLEITAQVVVCINLMDEAKRLGIRIDIEQISRKLGVPVIPVSARNKSGLEELLDQIESIAKGVVALKPLGVRYGEEVEQKIAALTPYIIEQFGDQLPVRWVALRLIDGEQGILQTIMERRQAPTEPFMSEGVKDYGQSACH